MPPAGSEPTIPAQPIRSASCYSSQLITRYFRSTDTYGRLMHCRSHVISRNVFCFSFKTVSPTISLLQTASSSSSSPLSCRKQNTCTGVAMAESWWTDRQTHRDGGNWKAIQSQVPPLRDKGPCSKASYLLGTMKEEICTFIALTLNINCLLGRDAVWSGTMNWYFEGACCKYHQGQWRTQEFFRGVNKFSWGKRTERAGIWGR